MNKRVRGGRGGWDQKCEISHFYSNKTYCYKILFYSMYPYAYILGWKLDTFINYYKGGGVVPFDEVYNADKGTYVCNHWL